MNLSADGYARLTELFEEASDLAPADRAAFLSAHPEFAAQLEALLAADAGTVSLLDGDAAEVTTGLLAGLQAGACGPYSLAEVLGEGGTGIVYRGHRADLGSTAAVKVLRDAWISPARRQRFEREQRTLASLQHPGIAKLLDAGLTPDGTPWIAMELVDGVPLTRYAREQALSVVQRLRLFQQVCAAVQYAHERAIIHRDLKPSNILVDSSGAPRLLDFGIARHLDDDAGLTRPEFRMMTPAYAAPEQVRGEAPGVYTDVYALGVILYELLIGEIPSTDGLRPMRPLQAARLPHIGKASWDELDIICSQAMHFEPAQRYRSADALGRDIARYLAAQPLEARPDSRAYKLRKFLERNRRAVTATAAAVAVLAGTALWFTWQLRQSRDEAVAAAARANRIQSFLMNLFEGGDAAAGPARGLTVETLIDRGVREAGALDNEPAVQGEVYETLGRMYGKLGRFQASEKMLSAAASRNRGAASGGRSLAELALIQSEQGRLDEARDTAREAIREGERVVGPSHASTIAAREALGRILTERGDYAEAVTILRESLQLREAAGDPAPFAATASALAAVHFYKGEFDESRRLNQKALAARIRAHGDRHPLVADDWISLGAIDVDTGRYAEAEAYYRRALAVKQAWYGADHADTASAQTMLGRALVYQKKHAEARGLLEKALATQRGVFGDHHSRVASTLNDLGNIFVAEENSAEAERCFQQMEDIYRASRGDGHYLVATAMSNRANVYLRRGDYPRAETMMRDVVARYTKALSADHVNTAIARIRLGRALLRQNRWREAVAESRAGHDLLLRQTKAPVSWLAAAREDLAAANKALGDSR